ncbi:hypothetical protein HYQ44_015419 [Verticillium longisporum]|nr:hypothetical protein HYQ44_015419 [Verticillium longisporum]
MPSSSIRLPSWDDRKGGVIHLHIGIPTCQNRSIPITTITPLPGSSQIEAPVDDKKNPDRGIRSSDRPGNSSRPKMS